MSFNNKDVKIYNFDGLHPFQHRVEIGLSAIKQLMTHQEKAFEMAKDSLDKEIDNDPTLKSLKNNEFYWSFYAHQYGISEDILDDILRSQRFGVCLTLFAFYESRIKEVCSLIENTLNREERPLPQELKKLNLKGGGVIRKLQGYLIDDYKVEFNTTEPTYELIAKQIDTRNIIAHNDGYVTEEDFTKKIRQLV